LFFSSLHVLNTFNYQDTLDFEIVQMILNMFIFSMIR
jgi:hypothetical protein